MKRKFSKYTRKTLSVFMAVIMVLSVFVFVPEMFTKAEAATAGNYTLKVNINVSNKADNKGNIQDSYFKITYKPNNGNGSETTMTYSLKR